MARVVSTSRSLNVLQGSLEPLIAAGHTAEAVDGAGLGEDEMADLARDCDGLIVGIEPVTRRVLEAASRLRIVARPGVGFDNVDVTAATDTGVFVTITVGANTDSVADLALALILACARRITAVNAAVHGGSWPKSTGLELRERTLGLIGMGAIGRAVADRAIAFGMQVVASDPAPDLEFARSRAVVLVDLPELLARADVISLHAPITPETRHLVDDAFLKQVRPGAVLVNTARGQLLDDAAVRAALDDGRLGAVGIDVFDPEPPVGSPLLGCDGAILTAHIASYTGASLRRMADMAIKSVLDALAGRRPAGLVNGNVISRHVP